MEWTPNLIMSIISEITLTVVIVTILILLFSKGNTKCK